MLKGLASRSLQPQALNQIQPDRKYTMIEIILRGHSCLHSTAAWPVSTMRRGRAVAQKCRGSCDRVRGACDPYQSSPAPSRPLCLPVDPQCAPQGTVVSHDCFAPLPDHRCDSNAIRCAAEWWARGGATRVYERGGRILSHSPLWFCLSPMTCRSPRRLQMQPQPSDGRFNPQMQPQQSQQPPRMQPMALQPMQPMQPSSLQPMQPMRSLAPLRPLQPSQPLANPAMAMDAAPPAAAAAMPSGGLAARRLRVLDGPSPAMGPNGGADAYSQSSLTPARAAPLSLPPPAQPVAAVAASPAPSSAPIPRPDFGSAPAVSVYPPQQQQQQFQQMQPQQMQQQQPDARMPLPPLQQSREPDFSRRDRGAGPPPRYGDDPLPRAPPAAAFRRDDGPRGDDAQFRQPREYVDSREQQQQRDLRDPRQQLQQQPPQPYDSRGGPAPYNPNPDSSRVPATAVSTARGSSDDDRSFDEQRSYRDQRASYDERDARRREEDRMEYDERDRRPRDRFDDRDRFDNRDRFDDRDRDRGRDADRFDDRPDAEEDRIRRDRLRPPPMNIDDRDRDRDPRDSRDEVRFHASQDGFYDPQTQHPQYPNSNMNSQADFPPGSARDPRDRRGDRSWDRDTQRPPVPQRMPTTPMRSTFSPHASKKDLAALAAQQRTASPVKDDRSAAPAEPLMLSVDELLSPQALQIFLPFFGRLGYTSMDSLVDMDDSRVESMLDEVEAEAEAAAGIVLKGGHRSMIRSRLRAEKEKRARAAGARGRGFKHGAPGSPGALGGGAAVAGGIDRSRERDAGRLGSLSSTRGGPVMIDGFKGLLRHWCCCLGVCIACIGLSVCFLLLYQNVGQAQLKQDSSSGGVNNGSVSSATSGGWKFLYILSILGFCLGGLAAMMAALSWLRNPEQRRCNCDSICEAWNRCTCPTVCNCDGCVDTLCCRNGCGGAAGDQVRLCCDSAKAQCALPECPECECGRCGIQECIRECGCDCDNLCADCRNCCDCANPCASDQCCQGESSGCNCWSDTERSSSEADAATSLWPWPPSLTGVAVRACVCSVPIAKATARVVARLVTRFVAARYARGTTARAPENVLGIALLITIDRYVCAMCRPSFQCKIQVA